MLSSIRLPSMARLGPSVFIRVGILLFWAILIPTVIRTLRSSKHEVRLLSSWASSSQAYPTKADPSACPSQAELEDVLVVVKTGSTESREKLPVHFTTTLRCVPNVIIVSDLAEKVGGYPVIDVLEDSVSKETLESEPEFKDYYQRLKAEGRGAISEEELAEWKSAQNTVFGATENLAWKLDKWKFVPMLDKAYKHKSDAKWYVFMEADSYINWENMLAWLAHFDPVKKLYLGEQMQIGDVLFGYGGTGYVLSNPAIRKALKFRQAQMAMIEDFTKREWAGDMILGWLMGEAGIALHWSWPNLQGEVPTDIDYFAVGWEKREWCYAAISYHHMKAPDITALDTFIRNWDGAKPLLHRDIFLHHVLPNIVATNGIMEDWDNLSDFAYPPPGHQEPVDSFDQCHAICEYHGACLQFSYTPGICRIAATVKLGHKVDQPIDSQAKDGPGQNGEEEVGMKSGWILPRIQRFMEFVASCEEGEWVLHEQT